MARWVDMWIDNIVKNEGGAPTYPVFYISLKEDTDELKINHLQTGQFVRLIHDFMAGDVVMIDCGYPKETVNTGFVTINSERAMLDLDISSDFFPLIKGVNDINVYPRAVANVEMHWVPRWKL
jgi:hypothetical protein